jgi:inorganic pyrophosphatase
MSAPPRSVEISIEVPRGGFAKRRPDGSVDFVSPWPCPFAYGSVHARIAEDGDPEDALVIGVAPARGARVNFPVWGRVHFVDAGKVDDKWICGPHPPTAEEQVVIQRFFRVYAVAKRVINAVRGQFDPTRFASVELFEIEAG